MNWRGLALWCLICAGPAHAEDYLVATRHADYRVALDELSLAIVDRDYTVVKIQGVDKGLRSKGYELFDDYKLVFFSNKQLEREALTLAPEFATLLPLKIILYQEGNRIVAVAPALAPWRHAFASAPAQALLLRFEQDTRGILDQYADPAQ
jgi:uncharacterized protein (DUF302 family)